MARLDEYLQEVQERQGLVPRALIRSWALPETDAVIDGLCDAIAASGLIGSAITNFAGTNQAKGNRAADHFIALVPAHLLAGNRLDVATGPGYPDCVLVANGVGCCMEMKATSDWQDTDSNRRVLMSTPAKIIKLVNKGILDDPPPHLICTVLYTPLGVVNGTRLDFLEPDSTVKIRLEASTSQQLLNQETHRTVILP